MINEATKALAFDDMIPSDSDIERLIFFFNSIDESIKKHNEMREDDPRFYLLAATTNRNRELPCVSDFIERCSYFINITWIERVRKRGKNSSRIVRSCFRALVMQSVTHCVLN